MPVSGFVVIRHPEVGVGTAPVEALELYEANGWTVVSDERPDPGYFNLSDYAAPEPAAAPESAPDDTEETSA